MLGLIYSGLLLLVLGGLLGGLMAWRTRERVARLERTVKHLQQRLEQPGVSTAGATDASREFAPTAQAASKSRENIPDKQTQQATGEQPPKSSTIGQLIAQFRANWMIWLGGLCIALAGIFLVKYSIDAGLLGPSARIVFACALGVGLHAIAEWLRRRTGESHPSFAALAGGASITLYAAMLAALHLYELLAPGTVFLLLAFIALATMAMALLHGPVLAIIGLLGAYTVPILVANEEGDIVSALIYVSIISAAALLLLRQVYRPWLWYGVLAGALGWWLISFGSLEAETVRGYYLAVLAYGLLAIPCKDWLLADSSVAHPASGPVRLAILRSNTISVSLLALSVLLVIGAAAISIAHDGFSRAALWYWAPLVAITLLATRAHPALAALPWVSLISQWFAWLYSVLEFSHGQWQLQALASDVGRDFLWFAFAMSVLYSGTTLWLGRGQPYDNLRGSMVALAPVCWLALAYLLVTDLSGIWQWSLVSLALGLVYAILSQRRLSHSPQGPDAIWLILAAHLAYTLAVAMFFREATLTLALAAQLISLAWLTRRFDVNNLDWLVKGVLALIVTRLTLNPWLLSYPTDLHWSLWTYGGAAACTLAASRMTEPASRLKPWLEAVALQLFVLFVAAETRYQLYDGEIFRPEYSLTEAAINTALWAGLGLVYFYRAQISEYLNPLYTRLSQVLMAMAMLNYLLVLTALNPLWDAGDSVGQRPIANLLLLAYGVPPAIALLASRIPGLSYRRIAALVAAAGGLIFVSLEIRHLWQGRLDIDLPTSEGELYTYSAVWLVLAVAAILIASRRRMTTAYKGGMALLMVVIAKLFLVDMAGLEGLLRVASFMGLGLSLLALAYLYQRISTGNENPPGESRSGGA